MAQDPEIAIYGNKIDARQVARGRRLRDRYVRRYGFDPNRRYPLRAVENKIVGDRLGICEVGSGNSGTPIDYDRGVFVGTIRMGYGHYRIALALASAAHSMGLTPYWFDLLGFDSPGAAIIRSMDKWYSFGSRLSQRSRLFNRLLWDPMFGKWFRPLARNYPSMALGSLFSDVYGELPKETPFLATHPFAAHGALEAGLNRVVNVIPDNCPLGFHLAAGGIQTVQSPSAYFSFRTLRGMGVKNAPAKGVPPRHLALTGHYVDHELAANILPDCEARFNRMDQGSPRRLLLSVGGAGAQQPLFEGILRDLTPRLREKSLTLFLNFGDHRHIAENLLSRLPGMEESAVWHRDWPDTVSFIESLLAGEPVSGLHLFLHEDIFAAVYTTNLLMRVSDLLLTKPSELAYYPIPTLYLTRVGGHEAWGAIRGSELGYGTQECTNLSETLGALRVLLEEEDLLRLYTDTIMKLDRSGLFQGAYRAVEHAVS